MFKPLPSPHTLCCPLPHPAPRACESLESLPIELYPLIFRYVSISHFCKIKRINKRMKKCVVEYMHNPSFILNKLYHNANNTIYINTSNNKIMRSAFFDPVIPTKKRPLIDPTFHMWQILLLNPRKNPLEPLTLMTNEEILYTLDFLTKVVISLRGSFPFSFILKFLKILTDTYNKTKNIDAVCNFYKIIEHFPSLIVQRPDYFLQNIQALKMWIEFAPNLFISTYEKIINNVLSLNFQTKGHQFAIIPAICDDIIKLSHMKEFSDIAQRLLMRFLLTFTHILEYRNIVTAIKIILYFAVPKKGTLFMTYDEIYDAFEKLHHRLLRENYLKLEINRKALKHKDQNFINSALSLLL